MNDRTIYRGQPSSYAFLVTKLNEVATRQIVVHAGNSAIAVTKAARYIFDDETLSAIPLKSARSTESGR